ncbi:Xaa-Pro peptidase family protein [Pigmentiphaga soli]|uniref:Xaa-Pro peptidase family protein n=1 Tax=Pigmentiphaga soli TaxID=1007095 RepID=A0ABP8GC49_9BURK
METWAKPPHKYVDYFGTRRRKAMDTLASSAGCDIVIGCCPEHFAFISNAHLPNITYIRSRAAYACIDADGKAFVVMYRADSDIIKEQSWIGDFAPYVEFQQDPVDSLVHELKARGYAEGRIGIDLDFMPAASYLRFKAALPAATIVDSFAAVSAHRAVKEPDEIRTVASAAQATHASILEAFAISKPGDTESQINARILGGCIARGARSIQFCTFGVGERCSHIHCYSRPEPVPEGEIIRCDVGPRFGPWFGDLARTYSTGKPTAPQVELYKGIVELQRRVIDMIRPGVAASEVYALAAKASSSLGLDADYPLLGHSLGLELHESPIVRKGDHGVLKAGMILNIEPIVRDRQTGILMHLEDLIEVTDTGARVLTLGLSPDEMPILGEPA